MTYPAFLARLEGVRSRGLGKASALCPAHQDRSPSLSVAEGRKGILLRCFAECDKRAIVASMGLTMADLFFDATATGHRPIPKAMKLDYTVLAFRYELAALDRRLRADNLLKLATNFSVDGLDDMQLDRLIEAVASAHNDRDRAAFLETVADDLRVKAFQERTAHHAA